MLQKLINILYRNPRSALRKYHRFGSFIAYQKMISARKEMERAAWTLPPVQSFNDGLPIYFLTGKKYAYQTLFCIASLNQSSQARFKFMLVDDGSFDQQLVQKLRHQLPDVTLINAADIEIHLNEKLPLSHYPVLRAKRLVYPHIKKLTDVHTLPGSDWKLVLDADMLFWQQPDELIQWLQHPVKPLHMVDCIESYGYTTNLMEKLCGSKLPKMLNVGAIGLNSSAIPWQNIETWINLLEQAQGGNYYLEQALSAMIVGNQPSLVLNTLRYQVNPNIVNDDSVLQHYVDLSRKIYFEQAWQKFR